MPFVLSVLHMGIACYCSFGTSILKSLLNTINKTVILPSVPLGCEK